MVDINGMYKMGAVKFIGPTEFAAGEWVGVAFDRPHGKFVVILFVISSILLVI